MFLHIIAVGQDSLSAKKPAVADLIKNKSFVFIAQSLTPMRIAYRQLTDYYYVKLTKDSLLSSLPFFGQSRIAPLDPTKIGIDITSTDFDYVVTTKKKGGWLITITPKDQHTINYFLFTIYDDGKTYLDVNSFDKDPISYNGYLGGFEH
ncbi:DUF4251 domain-containing protein [Ferruginibacter albus]|uniref:DUF4251 domain-containing protein n=1 Tax=Ferruginibacter albus TaxID=2875540 RepID=UPI001CC34F18|nr:DUF4251 domain-containing protein [Ferruginibacter albus]UAY50979.1 DUF4251 domain-containing protein [Ferruginibacter albus]